MNWQPIDTAPRDGRPVWARGDNFGNPAKGQHFAWAYWDGDAWACPGGRDESVTLLYLTDWMAAETAAAAYQEVTP